MRVKAVLKRSERVGTTTRQSVFRSGDFEVNFEERRLVIAECLIHLTPTECRLLQELILNKGKTLTYAYLLNKVWGAEYRDEKEYVHVFVNRLQAKLRLRTGGKRHIVNVPGVGYQFGD